MKVILRSGFLALAIMALAVPANSGPYEDGVAAYEQEDFETALRLWRQLAGQGHAKAQTILGIMYTDGLGVPQNYVEAVKWYRMAAEHGFADSQVLLGIAYAIGQGMPQDYAEAVKWYRKAAEQGHAKAQTILGIMYTDDRGVPKDSVLAYTWFNLAASQGYEIAQKRRGLVAEAMTPDQIAEAERLAREWIAKHPQ